MASDPAPHGDSDALARLAALLTAAADTAPTPRELAEVLWLARQSADRGSPGNATAPEDTTVSAPPAPVAPPADGEPPAAPPAPADRVPLHLPAPAPRPDTVTEPRATGGATRTPLLAPAPAMLPHPLALQRALRPLKRTVPAARARLLDERATADRIARLGAHPDVWLPVLRPARDRWLRLNLVHDTGPTMPVWRPLVRELHSVLAQSGVFRTVTLHPATPDGAARHVPDPADGRTVTLVVSDCTGPQWRAGPAGERWYRALRHWAARMPLAVVQPLPEHLWPTTALPAEPGVLAAPAAAAPLTALAFTPYDPDGAVPPPGGAVPLPVLEPGGPWLAHWAALVASPGGARTPGAAAWLPPAPPPPPAREPAPEPTPQDLVLRFRATASPEAFRLAGHLALAVPSVPVMRLVQRAVDRDPRPQHLAEVILSGMLTAVPGPPGSYGFRPGVRDLLLRTLPRTARGRTRELLERIGGLIDDRAGLTAGEFHVTAGAGPNGNSTAFATVREETVRRLGGGDEPGEMVGGRYRLVRKTGPPHFDWLAEDTREGDATVLVRRYRRPAQWFLAGFTSSAERLAGFRHPGVAAVVDHGVEDDVPYLVREFVEGRSLHRRLDKAPHGLPAAELIDLVPRIAEAVAALHANGRPFGGLTAMHVVLSPRGPVLTCLDAVRFGTGSRSDDLRDLGRLVHTMHRGTTLPESEQLPLPISELSLPERLAEALTAAVADLTSDGQETQLRGLERLLRLPSADSPVQREPRTRSTLLFETDTDLAAHPESRITLEYAVHQVLSRGALSSQQYEVEVRPNGYAVRVAAGTDLLPVLVAALRWLPDHWATLREPPRLLVAFGTPARRTARSGARMLIVVSPALYGSFTASSAAAGPYRFHPVYGDSSSPDAWYHPGAERRDLVKGPFVTRDLGRLGIPAPGRTAVVHTGPEGPLTLLNPADPYGGGPPRPVTYYDVDLTPQRDVHQLTLPGSGKGGFAVAAELTWRVDDPVAFVRAEVADVRERLLAHLREAGALITRHHSVRRPAGAQRALNTQLVRWPVPGLTVTCAVTLAPDYAPPPEVPRPGPADRPLAELLADAETVLFGFDGPLTRLFTATGARAAALDLLALVAEHRDPGDALAGRPVGDPGATRELFVHPLDVLRAFAQDRHGPLLRERLDALELAAVPDAPTTHRSAALVRALHDSGRRVGIATDVCERAVRRHLESRRLPLLAGVHGRADDLGRLMPHPDCLLRALAPQGSPTRTGVLVGSTLAELTAAQQVGLRFVGLARNPTVEQRLREAGCEVTVSSLTPVLEAARAL
ncbi:SAV_2336 N-terminal domain-related protein [Streptomyces sp. NPDC002920]